MTQVSALERAVIRNIAVIQTNTPMGVLSTYGFIQDIQKGPEPVKIEALTSVLVDLKNKDLIVQPTSGSVRLSDEGFDVFQREFPTPTVSQVESDVLDALRYESNLELQDRHLTAGEVRVINELTDIRRNVAKLMKNLDKAVNLAA